MLVEVTDATISFGRRVVFSGFSAVFEPGRVTALVGPSGSGKSSLLAAMGGHQKLSKGSIVLTDSEGVLSGPNPSAVAWVPQGANALKARSVLDNVCITPLSEGRPLGEALEISRASLQLVGLAHVEQQMARTLSGGELQRLAFARAIAAKHTIVFADEPSASLDEDNTRVIAQLLASLHTASTVVVATHDPVLIEAADVVVTIRAGDTHAA